MLQYQSSKYRDDERPAPIGEGGEAVLREFALRGTRRERSRPSEVLVGRIRAGDDFALEARVLLATVLTGRTWTLTAVDEDGTDWSNSTLVFTSQVQQPGNTFKLEGYFDWRNGVNFRGRELFHGALASDGQLTLDGYELQNPAGIILGHYHARVGADGNSIVDGSWANGIPGTWSATAPALPAGDVDLVASPRTDRIVPVGATDLNLNHVFGTELVNVPVHVGNLGTAAARGAVTIAIYASLTTGINSQLKLGETTFANLDLAPGGSNDFTVTVTIPSDRLTAGQAYYFVAEVRPGAIAEKTLTNNVAATTRTFVYAGNPTANPGVFSNGTYFKFIRDTLKGNLAAKAINAKVNLNDAKSFVTTFEGQRLYPYRDARGVPSIGVGLNLNTISGGLRTALVKAVRSYYRAHSRLTLPSSENGVIALLKSQARPLSSSSRAPAAISTADSQALLNMALSAAVTKARSALGTTTYNRLGAAEKVAVIDLAYDEGSVPSGAADALKHGDFVRAGFNLVNARRTTQASALVTRTEAEYQNLLTLHAGLLGKIVT